MAKSRQIADRIENQYFGICLDNVKNSWNIGATLRTAGAFGAAFVAWSGQRFLDKGKEASLDTECARYRIPVFKGVDNLLPYVTEQAECVAIELCDDATSLFDYVHNKNSIYFFGPEDGSLDPKYLNICKKKVYVPTKYSLNLAQCVNIVCYDRMMKMAASAKLDEKVIRCPSCGHNYYTTFSDYDAKCNACGKDFKIEPAF